MIKYSFVVTYYRKPVQLHNTLVSIRHFYSRRDDYEYILVIDVKTPPDELSALYSDLENFKDINIVPFVFDAPGAEKDLNRARLINEGARRSSGEYLIITGPEIFHPMDVLGWLDQFYLRRPGAYVVSSCIASFTESPRIDRFEDFQYTRSQWYQHPRRKLNNKGLYWLACMPMHVFLDSGGVNERYARGLGYEDNDFILRVRHAGADIVRTSGLWVVHQAHGPSFPELSKRELKRLSARNDAIFVEESMLLA